ncbi:hypothetical protein Pan189_32940 [Stratiformator vulcanicus]|uniref:Uncharacterized protein n=1 Tax=Stratiformator vulcanicus TaxID=2527980 RepID=A0A517R4T8_9PLAN|nr:hypothetical protein Pan189_32940 [Stratiformator vulcanicus]
MLPQAQRHAVPPLRLGEGWGEGVRRLFIEQPRQDALSREIKSKQRCRWINAPPAPHPAYRPPSPEGEGPWLLPQAQRHEVPPLRSGEGWGEGVRRRFIGQPRSNALLREVKSERRCRWINAPPSPHPAFGHLLPREKARGCCRRHKGAQCPLSARERVGVRGCGGRLMDSRDRMLFRMKLRANSSAVGSTPHLPLIRPIGHLLPRGEGPWLLPQAQRCAVPPLRSGEGWGEGVRRRFIGQPRSNALLREVKSERRCRWINAPPAPHPAYRPPSPERRRPVVAAAGTKVRSAPSPLGRGLG